MYAEAPGDMLRPLAALARLYGWRLCRVYPGVANTRNRGCVVLLKPPHMIALVLAMDERVTPRQAAFLDMWRRLPAVDVAVVTPQTWSRLPLRLQQYERRRPMTPDDRSKDILETHDHACATCGTPFPVRRAARRTLQRAEAQCPACLAVKVAAIKAARKEPHDD